MAHLHNVYDSDIHFKLDLKTRLFLNESELKTLVAQGDHNSERFTFEIPRYIERHDMTLCNRIEIYYININSSTKETSQDVYIVDDMQVSPDDTNVVIFSWLLSNNATKYNGNLSFVIKFKCITNDVVDYQWSTLIYSKVQVCSSYDHAEQVITVYTDVLEKWKQELIDDMKQNTTSARIGEVRLTANGWIGNASPYSQVVNVAGVTENSQVDLTPSVTQLSAFWEKDLAFVTENVGGVVTVYAIGQKPTNDYTIQVTITEVE